MSEVSDDDIHSILRDMQDEYWRSLETPETREPGATRQFLVFHLGDERFGIATELAREVLRPPRLVRVPQVPGFIRGVINLRGEIVAVTDLREALGLPPAEGEGRGRLIVVEAAGLTTALATDGVDGIRSVSLEAIEPPAAGVPRLPRETVTGQVHEPDGPLLLLDLPALLAQERFTIDQKGE